MSTAALLDGLGRTRRAALIALVFGLPLVVLWDVTSAPFETPKLALLVVATSLAAAARVGEIVLGRSAGRLRAAALPAAFIAVPTAVAWLATDYKSWSLVGSHARFTGLVPLLLVVLAGVLLADAFRADLRLLAWALVSSAAISGLYALAQSVGLDPFDMFVLEYVPSTVGHSNFLGGFLAIALPVSLGLATSATGRGRYAALAAAIAIAIGIVLSFSQGGWIAAAAGAAVFAGGGLGTRYRHGHAAGWIVAGALAAAVVGLVLLSLVDPFNPVVPGTTRARGVWWKAAASMGSESPLWGRGPGVYAIEGPHHRVPEDALAHDTLYADEPHSVPLAYFANAGILGLGGFVALGAWIVRRGRKTASSPVLRGFGAGAAAYLVQSLVSIDVLVTMLALWTCIAALTPTPEERRRKTTAPRAAAGAVAVVLVAAVVVGSTWWTGRFLQADIHARDAIEAFERRDTQEAVATFEKVLRIRDNEHYRHIYASFLGNAALREQENGDDEIAQMRDAFEFVDDFPNVRPLSDYGDLLHQWSIYEPALEAAALEQLERYLSLDEYSPTVRVLAAEALIRLGRADDAVQTLERMVPLMERFPEYIAPHPKLWGALATAYFYDEREEDAHAALERAEEAAAGTPRVNECPLLVARELIQRSGRPATRDEYSESSGTLLLCRPATLALLPGWNPQERE